MRLLTVLTAALAAGSISFASVGHAASTRATPNGTEAPERTPIFTSAKPEKPKASAPAKANGKSAGKQVATKSEVKSRGGKQKRRSRPSRTRVIIDTTTTASIPVQAYPVPSARATSKYDLYVSRYAASNGVPVSLAHAVIKVESNYRPDARGSAGEVGLMQIKPATARMMGYRGSVKGLYDPETNIKYGMMYLGMAHKLGGGATCTTILKYNAGHAARRMNPVSSAYCGKVQRSLAGL
jgi:soluble lytic murein transglycosylase-like protein